MVCCRCAQCCKLGVTVGPEDLNREPRLWNYVDSIHKTKSHKMARYMRIEGHPYAIRKAARFSLCVFLGATGCLIYETRPQVCRDYACKRSENKVD